ncbi:protein TASOR 2-like [Chiroxiphia lanceolata]|uniref:protein TASOR 2-like n=1 Tax=Chiroxiphia lanceolata TaxID=296741 RepID=UPI0013CEFDB3|nr:protein TASOR 2-like [Chiroxiphia lanceolata]
MGSEAFPHSHRASAEVEEGEILTSPIPVFPFREHRDPSGERLEFSDAEDALDTFPRAQQLLSRDTRRGVAFQDPLDLSSSDSEQEYFGRNPRPPLPARASRGARSVDAAGARTNGDDSSVEGLGDGWDQGVSRDSRHSVITRHRRERPGNSQPPRRRHRRAGESHLLRNNLLGDWRGSEELTQNTLDMECLRFHYKLNQVLGNRKPPFSTSESIFPRDFSRRDPLTPPSAQDRSPLQVTIPPSHTWLGRSRSRWQRGRHEEDTPGDTRRRSPSRSRPPFCLGKLHQDGRPLDSWEDVTVVLDEYSELPRVVLSRADAGKEGGGHGEPRDAGPGPSRRGRPAAFQGMIGELCGALRSHLRRVASEASTHPGMFYLVETGKEPFFERVKALLRKEGWVRTEPRSFCGGRRRAGDQLLVIIRNEDISSHIHTIPGLLELKRCPGVVFAGVDNPEDVTGHTYQELFHTGGFLVSDTTVLESMSLARLKEVVKVLEKLNRSGRWKVAPSLQESKKLRGDLRVTPDAHGKQLLLKWCQEEGLVEVLPFHGCDSPGAPEKQLLRCLLGLQVQHVRARLGVFLTQNPGARREVLESKGILVADVSSFLGTLQGVAAPFRRSYW